ncbi:MAG: glycosyltransferase family 39 protein, partial [Blastocatellia bacterium]|nr:glycosyltransferase family 39 protein [Blastocatellia bacterium]
MKPNVKIIWLAVLLNLFLSVVFIYLSRPWLTDDSLGHIDLANSILNGSGFGRFCSFGYLVEPSRLPGYPGFIAILFVLFGDSHLSILLVQSLLLAASVFLTYRIAIDIFGISTAYAFLMFSVIYPFLANASALISPEILCLFFTTAGICALKSSKRPALVLSGIMFSAASYVRPNMILLGCLIAFFCIVFLRERRLNYLFIPITIAILFVPWTIRNYYVFGKITPTAVVTGLGVSVFVSSWESRTSTRTIISFGKGNINEEAQNSGLAGQVDEISNKLRECCPDDDPKVLISVATCDTTKKQSVIDQEMLRHGVDNIKAEPLKYLWNCFINSFRMWFTYFGLDSFPFFIRLPLIFLGVAALALGLLGIAFVLFEHHERLRNP